MKNENSALLWDEDLVNGTTTNTIGVQGNGKDPITQTDMDAFVATEPETKEEIKTYVHSNVQRMGKGADSWFSTTMTARNEIFGAAEVGIAKNILDNKG